jgi:hypothetical protein
MSARRAGGAIPRPLGILDRGRTAAALAAAVFVLLVVAPVSAHEGGPRLILDPAKVNPGGVVLIRGEDLALDELMRLSLVGDVGAAELGTVTTDGEGHFTIAVDLPADAPVGTYAIQATTPSGAVIKSLLELAGSPILEQGGAPPGQDEGFPAVPAASVPPAAIPAATAASAGSGLRPLSDPTGTAGEFDLVPFVALFGAVGALAFLIWRTRRSTVARQVQSPES